MPDPMDWAALPRLLTEPWTITVPAWVAAVIPIVFAVAVVAAGWRGPHEECQRRHVDDEPALRLEDISTVDLHHQYLHLVEAPTRPVDRGRDGNTARHASDPDVVLPWDPAVRRARARQSDAARVWRRTDGGPTS